MDNDIVMPSPLTNAELNELEDLEGWINDLFVFAGMKLPDDRIERMASSIRHDDAIDAAVERVKARVMAQIFPDDHT